MMRMPADFLLGWVRAEFAGAFPENVLNLLAGSGVRFRRVEKTDVFTLRVTLRERDWARAQALAARAQCSAVPLSRGGSAALRRRLRRRTALLACLALCALTVAASSLFLWDVEVRGNERVSTGELLRALEECGVREGAFWPDVDSERVRDAMLLKLPELSWLAVNLSGSRALVEVRERTPKPVIVDNDAPVDVVARKAGILVRLDVLQGVPRAQAGDAVLPGELLVSGTAQDLQGGSRTVHAMASVRARTAYELTAAAPLTEARKTAPGRARTRFALIFGRTRINFYADSGNNGTYCDKIIRETRLGWRGVFELPAAVVCETYRPWTLSETELSADAVGDALEARLRGELALALGDWGEAVSVTAVRAVSGGMMTVTLRADCLEDIASEVPRLP